MNIRKARVTDIEAIHSLDRESIKYHEQFDKDFYTVSESCFKLKKESQVKAMKSQSDLILVAEMNGKVVGYIWGRVEKVMKEKSGKVQEIIVTSQQRGKGIGKALMKQMLNFFKEKGCIISETEVFVENVAAIKAYESAGFKKREYKMQLHIDKTRRFKPFC
jgi:ribosomal protein S18 acetylase RimI-like enzyme